MNAIQRLKTLKRVSSVITIISITLLIGFKTLTLAQENQINGLSITISPYLLDLRGKPGETITEKIRIKNNLSQNIKLNANIYPLEVRGENGAAVPKEQIEPYDTHIEWLTIENTNIQINPQEWVEVPIIIEIPQTAAFGYYYAITFSPATLQQPQDNGAQTIIKGEVAVFVLLNVEKEGAKSELKLLSFKPTQNIFQYLPAKFQTRVENTGNVHIRPQGNIFIRQFGSNKDIATLNLNETNGNVLPGTKRIFETEWKDGFIVRNKDTNKLEFNWNKLTDFRFGQYEARLALVYFNGNRDILLEATQTFWIIPYTAIAITLTIILASIIITRWLLKKYITNQIKKLSATTQTPTQK